MITAWLPVQVPPWLNRLMDEEAFDSDNPPAEKRSKPSAAPDVQAAGLSALATTLQTGSQRVEPLTVSWFV